MVAHCSSSGAHEWTFRRPFGDRGVGVAETRHAIDVVAQVDEAEEDRRRVRHKNESIHVHV